MNRPRIMSKDSAIYHRHGCRYALRIKKENKVELGLFAAEVQGLKPCTVCNRMSFIYGTEKYSLMKATSGWNMTFKIVGEELFIKTSIGLWKLIYRPETSKIALYHRNAIEREVNFECPENEPFHRQKDLPPTNAIFPVCKYIFEHDRYKEARILGKKLHSGTVSKKYQKKAKKFERKESMKRVNSLFKELEKADPKLKDLSFN